MCGGDSSKTDRKTELAGFGKMSDIFSQLSEKGSKLSTLGSEDTGKASKFYSDVLSGDPKKMMEAASPEINTIKNQSTAAKRNLATGGGRTGGTNEAGLKMDADTRAQISRVLSEKRGDAATGLSRIGGAETGQGIGATESAGNVATNYTSIASDSRKTSKAIHDETVTQWADVAASLLLG